jgi:uncharacterized membrane protein
MERHGYPTEGGVPPPSYEDTPLTRLEYIQALVHLYRGELDRSTQWRLRLDTTTNWAIFSVMGLVTFTLGEPDHSHVGVIAGMALVFTFLTIEARRFRFFDVWRARLHMLEENFYGPILRRDLRSPLANWGRLVAEDLLHPRFKVSFQEALRARLLRNYFPLFVLLLVCWVLKLFMHPGGRLDALDRMALGPVPGWVPLVFVTGLYAYLAAVVLFVRPVTSPEIGYWGTGTPARPLSRLDA